MVRGMKFRALSLAPALAAIALAAPPAQAATGFGLLPAAFAFNTGPRTALPCLALSASAAVPIAPAAGNAPSKAESILGGAPSRMEMILRQQGAPMSPVIQPALGPALAAAGGAPQGTACGAQMPLSGTAALVMNPLPRPDLASPAAPFRSAVPTSPDDFLSSHRLTISRTSFDGQWARVSNAALRGRTVRKLGLAAEGSSLVARLELVNAWANRSIRYTEDAQQYGQADYWADPAQTLRRRAGDCEDIAILKMQLLAAAGVPRSAMYLTIARDLARRADHALLVVRDGDKHWLLDNATDTLSDAATAQDYRPIFSFSESGKWLHGY